MPLDQPRATTLRELLVEMRRGFSLHAPILIRVEPGSEAPETTAERTVAMGAPPDWADQYTREYANELYLLLGPNRAWTDAIRPLTIGRSRRCDVTIENDSISKVHASFAFDRACGDYYVVDENSLNGTCINGEPLAAGARAWIWPGAYLSFGDAVFVFVDAPTLRKLSRLAMDA